MKQKVTKIAPLNIPADLKKELDELVATVTQDRRWNEESEAVLRHYIAEGVPTNILCKVLEKAFPDKTWPYSIVNSKVQYVRKR